MTNLRIALVTVVVVACVPLTVWLYYEQFANPRVARQLVEEPGADIARRVMLLTLPSGREIPVNYLRHEQRVYAGADGRWWRELVGAGAAVQVILQGETWSGRARAVTDDPAYTKRIFRQLRPDAIQGMATLIEIELGERVEP